MKKKIVKISALLICICFLFSGCSVASTFLGIESDDIEYTIENGEATVTSVPNKINITKIVIPDEYEGVPVTKIADFSATNLEYVTEITIGKNDNIVSNILFFQFIVFIGTVDVFICTCQHQFDSVQLVDFGCTGVVVDRNNI